MKSKTCATCGEVKPLDQFGKSKGCKGGRRGDCRKCLSEKQMARDRRQPEKVAAYHEAYYEANRPKWTESRQKRQQQINADKRRRYQEDPQYRAAAREKAREWHQNNPAKKKAQRLRKYGLTIEEFGKLMERAECKCEICGFSDTSNVNFFPCIDHCHNTLEVRGILCGRCNKAIGLLLDNPTLALNAASYLQKSSGNGDCRDGN